MLQLARLIPAFLVLALQVTSSLGQRDDDSPMTPVDQPTTLISIRDEIYGERNVSYFTTEDNLVVIDVDVIYGTAEDIRSHSFAEIAQNRSARAFTIFSNGNIWPGADLRYKYDSAATQTLLNPIVTAAIARWTAGAPWLKFTKVANSNVGENGVVMIRAPVCGGCNTNIGWKNAPMTMNLQQSCPKAPGICGTNEATHEFGHLLGFFHEHQRPTRELTVHYNCANLNPSCPSGVSMPSGKTCCSSGLPAGCCSTAGNFAIINSASADSSGPYDITSIMQYRANAFAIPGTNTLTPVAPGVVVPVGNIGTPSARDFNRLCKIYKANCPAALTCASQGCPANCSIIKKCNNQVLCNTDFAPPCCDPSDANEICQIKKDACTKQGCNFLLQ